MTNNLTFFDLLNTYGVEASHIRLVRHGNKEIDVLNTYINDIEKFTEYTAWQRPGKYGDAKYLAIFSPSRGTTALFLGLWKVTGVTKNEELKPEHLNILKKFQLPEIWYERSDRYDLELSSEMTDLTQRLIIDWGGSTVSWVQKKNKSVVEIRPVNSIGEFSSYDDVCKRLMKTTQ